MPSVVVVSAMYNLHLRMPTLPRAQVVLLVVLLVVSSCTSGRASITILSHSSPEAQSTRTHTHTHTPEAQSVRTHTHTREVFSSPSARSQLQLPAFPNGYVWGCLPGNVSAGLPFCNSSLPVAARVYDLVSRLTLKEKLGLLGGDENSGWLAFLQNFLLRHWFYQCYKQYFLSPNTLVFVSLSVCLCVSLSVCLSVGVSLCLSPLSVL